MEEDYWKKRDSTNVHSFISKYEDEVIYVIPKGHDDVYMVIHDSAHEYTGSIKNYDKEGFEKIYNIKLD